MTWALAAGTPHFVQDCDGRWRYCCYPIPAHWFLSADVGGLEKYFVRLIVLGAYGQLHLARFIRAPIFRAPFLWTPNFCEQIWNERKFLSSLRTLPICHYVCTFDLLQIGFFWNLSWDIYIFKRRSPIKWLFCWFFVNKFIPF